VLAAFGMLVLDRDAARARIADVASAATDADLAGSGPRLGIRWRRVLAGVFLGCACASKWDGIWFILAFGGLAIAWDLGARRAAGYRDRLDGVLRSDVKWLPVTFLVIPFATYLASWSGWFASHYGYDRFWAQANGNHLPVWSEVDSLYQYHKAMMGFALSLHDQTGYVSRPWSWLVLGRPVSFFWNTPKGCGGTCAQEVLAIGTPAIWWASIPALLFCLGWWIMRREWRSGALLLAVAAGWLPWFWYAWHNNRTEYYFYAVVFLPYLVMAITLCLGLIIGPAVAAPGRRAVGAVIAGAYLLLVLANFAWFYPVLTAQPIPHNFWQDRMVFQSWI
jgi:dolichyl-phosphate-mannose--protein O-mannosyl transferase